MKNGLLDGFTVAREALRCAPYSNGQASIQALKSYVEEQRSTELGRSFTVRIYKSSEGADGLRALILRYEAHAEIVVSAELNVCWTRFAVIKELMHLLVDDQSTFLADIVAQLGTVQTMFSGTEAKADSETTAMVAAMEYSFRYDLRPEPPMESSLVVATRFRIPQRLVEMHYDSGWTSWSRWGQTSLEIHRKLETPG